LPADLVVMEIPGIAARELAEFNATHESLPPPVLDAAALRVDYWPMASAVPGHGLARDEVIAGIPCRVVRPDRPRAVYIHLHGGGFILGSAARQDRQHEGIARKLGAVVVSIDYRLAPEHPYPAGLDDAVAVTRSIVGDPSFDGLPLLIGGESAGANLAVGTLLRLRDAGLAVDRFVGANLVYGGYSMAPLPGRLAWGDRYLVLSGPLLGYFHDSYAAPDDDPYGSPLLADLHDLPAALFTVGTEDPLYEDSVRMADRWSESNAAELHVWPGAPHAIDAFPIAVGGMVRRRLGDWLQARL
jgi:acetyl esterase